MTSFNAKLLEVVQKDPRFAYEAYEFVFQALHHTQKLLDREPPREGPSADGSGQSKHHVSGRELLLGIRSLALEEFGLMAPTVFRMWGLRVTDDFGDIVFNLVNADLMSKTDQDNPQDFHAVYDFADLTQEFRIELEEAEG